MIMVTYRQSYSYIMRQRYWSQQ